MVYVHFAEGFEEIEAVIIVDVLRRAGIETRQVSITGNLTVCGSHGISICADELFEEVNYDDCEMIVLPGGMPGTKNLLAHEGLASKIIAFAESKKFIAAICAAPMVFGKLGILNGKKATIYPGMEENLIGADAKDDRVVIDDNIITSKGPGTAIEFSLALVGILKSREEAAKLGKSMVTGL
jgi:4-methyl-5(b-hydroxyethyl)-thiazole monophosphate biosynthesis